MVTAISAVVGVMDTSILIATATSSDSTAAVAIATLTMIIMHTAT